MGFWLTVTFVAAVVVDAEPAAATCRLCQAVAAAFGFRVKGLGFRVKGLGFRARVQGL